MISDTQYTQHTALRSASAGSALAAELYRHNKTGGVYQVICNAAIEATNELAVVYSNVETGERWVRPASEFNDGRFTRIYAQNQTSTNT